MDNKRVEVPWPELEELTVPGVAGVIHKVRDRLPMCPLCHEDELGLIHHDLILCYNCRWEQTR